MEKVDRTICLETFYIIVWTVIFSFVMQAVFLLLQKWDYTVLLGNLLSAVAAIGNFYLMGITIQKAIKKEEKQAITLMRFSQTVRTLMLFVIVAVGVLLPCFHILSVLIPLFFPRIAIAFRPLFLKKRETP